MEQSIIDLREQRLQKLFADCQREVLSQIIGPFGLSMAMFEDKNGGNVTTLHNFERPDDDYIATASDKVLHAQANKAYDSRVRADYEIKTVEAAKPAGGKTWEEKRAEKIARGKDEYTGRAVSPDGLIVQPDGRVVRAELDHVKSIGEFHRNKKAHLALGDVQQDENTGEMTYDSSRMRATINADENLALTNQPLNGSKSDSNLDEWAESERPDGTTNAEKFGVDEKRLAAKTQEAQKYQSRTVNHALLKKQATELLHTGGQQALQMGFRQAMGLLLTELVNGLFNEIRTLIEHGIEAGQSLFEEIRLRLMRVIQSVIQKVPDAVGQLFQGGVSGFMSNLITFLINSVLSTARRFVRVIREGLLGLFRAFKMIFFPPKDMTADQALQEGLKILSTVICTSVGLLLEETVAAFMLTIPFLKPIAELMTPVLIGILTGLLSAFMAYQIDCMFDRYRHALSEKFMDGLLVDAQRRDAFATELTTLAETSLGNIENYSKSIAMYQYIGATLGSAGLAAAATLASVEQTVVETGEQVAKSFAMINFINDSQSEIEDFLNTLEGQ
jgi:hypothetical protein